MRLGFAITGIGAACAFAVVSSRSTLALHGTSREFFASPGLSAGVELVTRDSDDVIRLDQLLSVEDPAQLLGGPHGVVFDTHPPPPPPSSGGSWPLPISALAAGYGLDGAVSIARGAAQASTDPAKTPPPPADPPPLDPPLKIAGLSAGAPLGSVQQLPPASDPGGEPPVFSPPPDLFTPPSPVPDGVDPPPPPPPPPPSFVSRPAVLFAAVTAPPSAVPEPASWIAMLVGFGAMGAQFRRRQAQRRLRPGDGQGAAPPRAILGSAG